MPNKTIKALGRAALIAALASQAACVSMQATPYNVGMDSSAALARHTRGAPVNVGAFAAEPKLDRKALSVRGSTLNGGADGRFSTYLHDALQAELRSAGRLDPSAATGISGELLEQRLEGGGPSAPGTAQIKARFVVSRDGKTLYDRTLSQQHQWESSFIGAIAIPAAFDNYVTTVQKLLQQLFADPQFEQATSR
ncbi:hypothetical protein J5226_19870 [Lysobacter sp. K5869]|uniref:hypothetical protein n=1 Tax=Lysobacter sp. K5869 TaxID=2820808 RepID=UPI001C0623CE|nr:hypothetical protein [Lysobacter sp. K5869]QWP75842.1 hypothetical protein J5226_19870 [Lysobacter sp. K5869]